MQEGLIVKALSGYYYVLPDNANNSFETLQCRARGIFKKKGVSPLVGDRVLYEETENGEGVVDEILPRTTELIRPPIANVDLAVLVFAVNEPALNLQLLDKFLVHTESAGLESIICLTKQDLLDDPEHRNSEDDIDIDFIRGLYEPIGYEVISTSARAGSGTSQVADRLAGRIGVFAGQSGVGKSSLLNAMIPGLQLETNQISVKLGRGKHTTRHVELIRLDNGGLVADTPGFSQLDFLHIEAEELGSCFKEFRSYAADCKFRGCTHLHEPGCKVMEAKAQGSIAETRYSHYMQFMADMKEKKRRY